MTEEQHGSDSLDEEWYSAAQYKRAINSLQSKITPLQRQMLVAHADAPDHMFSVRQLAAAGGYSKPNVTYSQYGRLGRLIARSLEVEGDWKVWTHFIGQNFRAESGELIWEMHPELVKALASVGWSSRSGSRSALTDIAQAEENKEFDSDTEREAIVQARIGQGPFRIALLKYWGACAVSSVSEPAVLRASHIKPWRDASNSERLDPGNGLLLAAHLDALFDAGLITFDAEGWIQLSSLLAPEDMLALGVLPTMRLRHVTAQHQVYLEHHRDFVFRSSKPKFDQCS